MNETQIQNVSGRTGENIVFIIGSPRSGTTWLQRLVASHPCVQTGQESKLFLYVGTHLQMWREDLVFPSRSGRCATGLACYLKEEEFLGIHQSYFNALLDAMLKPLKPGQIFLEKTPSHALFVPEIIQLLPAAKIIHIIRNPHDVVASMLAAARSWGAGWAPRKVSGAVRVWHQHVTKARQAGAALPPDQFMEVCYENLVAAPKTGLRAVVDFLKLAWSDAEIAAAVSANAAEEIRRGKGTAIPLGGDVAIHRGDQVREPADFVRKARPGSWKQDLTWWERWKFKCCLKKLEKSFSGDL